MTAEIFLNLIQNHSSNAYANCVNSLHHQKIHTIPYVYQKRIK